MEGFYVSVHSQEKSGAGGREKREFIYGSRDCGERGGERDRTPIIREAREGAPSVVRDIRISPCSPLPYSTGEGVEKGFHFR